MTDKPDFATAEVIPTEAPCDDWVLQLSLVEPAREPTGGVPWVERGPFRCFFDGLLFDREALADSTDRECSDADRVLQTYERGGEDAVARLRGSFVVAVVDRVRRVVIVARDPVGTHPLFYVESGSF